MEIKVKKFRHEPDGDHDEANCSVCTLVNADSFAGMINDVKSTVIGYFLAAEEEGQEISRMHFFLLMKVIMDFFSEELEVPDKSLIELAVAAIGFESQEIEMNKDQLQQLLTEGETVH